MVENTVTEQIDLTDVHDFADQLSHYFNRTIQICNSLNRIAQDVSIKKKATYNLLPFNVTLKFEIEFARHFLVFVRYDLPQQTIITSFHLHKKKKSVQLELFESSGLYGVPKEDDIHRLKSSIENLEDVLHEKGNVIKEEKCCD